jgi:hypothetical protein
MNKTLIRISVTLGSLVLLYLCVVLVASITQLADAADRVYLGMGQPVFWTLMTLFLFFVASPLYLYFKLPKALVPPEETTGIKHEEYLTQLRQRLSSNTRLIGVPLNSRINIESAMVLLSTDADKIVRETATTLFICTAISQNGRLDGLISLVTQARMVWRIACVYQQRPSPRQMIYLYSNVGANALLAEPIQDIDLSEIIAPILSSSLASSIPGASLIVNSFINGAANAFMTLRVGSITRQYCEALSTPARGLVRRNATLSAAAYVGIIIKENSARILSGSWGAVKGMVGSTMQGAKDAAGTIVDSAATGVKTLGGVFDSTVQGVKGVAGKITSRQ